MIKVDEPTNRGIFSKPYMRLEVDGAGAEALYRAYLAAFGESDGATRDIRRAIRTGDLPWVEELDYEDAGRTAELFAGMGLLSGAQRLYNFSTIPEEEDLHERAAALLRQAERLCYARPTYDLAVRGAFRG